jgi:hypothetical protein
MRPLRGYYWLLRANSSANWWLVRYDLHTAWLFLRYAVLALRGRVLIVDERVIERPGSYTYLQLAISPLPLVPELAFSADEPADQPPPPTSLLFRDRPE